MGNKLDYIANVILCNNLCKDKMAPSYSDIESFQRHYAKKVYKNSKKILSVCMCA